MIFLDTIHTYEQVLAEFILWEPYMKDDCVMLIDDIRPSMEGRTKWRFHTCLLYTSPSPRDRTRSRMPSSA